MPKAKGKPTSSVPGAYLCEDGKPRWKEPSAKQERVDTLPRRHQAP